MNVELAVKQSCLLGECPIWDTVDNRLYYLDILGKTIYSYNPINNNLLSYVFDIRISAIARDRNSNWLAATECGFVRLNLDDLNYVLLADPEFDLPNNRFNDGKIDQKGRFWAGTMDEINSDSKSGKLYRLDEYGNVNIMIDQVGCSNGMAWSLDDKQFYFIDSLTYSVVVYDYDSISGVINNSKLIFRFDPEEGLPDGMCIDQFGFLWIAIWGGGKVLQLDPYTKQILNELVLPVKQVTSCAFNLDYSELYITTANIGMSEDDLLLQPDAGSLFKFTLL